MFAYFRLGAARSCLLEDNLACTVSVFASLLSTVMV